MNPATNERPSLNLPPPITGAEQPVSGQVPETAPRVEVAAAPITQAPAVGGPTALPVQAVSSQPLGQSNGAAPAASATVVDDADLIEKEWVNKAKQIIERTREDPYQQSKDMTNFRSDYMQQRYQKTIKSSD